MHLKRVMRSIVALGLAVTLSISNLTSVAAMEASLNNVVQDSVLESQGLLSENNEEEKNDSIEEITDDSTEDKIGKEEEEKEEEKEEEEKKEEEESVEKPVELKGDFVDDTQTSYRVELHNYSLDEGESLYAAVWSAANEQKDLKRITLDKNEDGSYGTTFKISDFKSAGEYIIHVYCKKADKTETYIIGKRFIVQELSVGKVEVLDTKHSEGSATIKISDLSVPSGVKKVSVAVWSSSNQNDLHWYTAEYKEDGWYVQIDIAKHHKNNWNSYVVHVYAKDGNGFEKFVGGTGLDFSVKTIVPTVSWDEKTGVIEFNNEDIVTPGSFKDIKCAVWSDANGQDDLKWYNMEYNKHEEKWIAKFPLTMFKSIGTCITHAYIVKNDGSQVYLGGKQFNLPAVSYESYEVNVDNAKGDFSIALDNVKAPFGCEKIQIAVWSTGDQSDLVWYEAERQNDDTYIIESNIKEHDYNIGKYYIHAYATDKLGIKTCIMCTEMEFKMSVGKIVSEEKTTETVYNVTLTDVEYPAELKEVRFAVWSTANGQDDLKWYTAVNNGNDYQVKVDINNHKTTGMYIMHVYGITKSGKSVYLSGCGNMFDIKANVEGKIAVSDKNEDKGTFKVTVFDIKAPAGVKTVKMAVWSQSNQSDLYWYTCKQEENGKWTATVDVANHKYYSGTYIMHTYVTLGNGIERYVAGTAYKIEPKNLTFVYSNNEKGERVIGICNPSQMNNIRLAVWSEANGQDDLKWFTASKSTAGTWSTTMSGYDFNDYGTFKMHVYAGSTCLRQITFQMTRDEVVKNGWFYRVLNGKKYKLYYIENKLQTDVTGIIGPQAAYRAEVNRVACTVTMYAKDGANGYIIPVKVFACSVGLPETPTPLGTYYTTNKYRWWELMGPSWGQYCTRIVHGILFHSVAGYTNKTIKNISAANYNMLGSPASHGCVRLTVRDAKWIYDNCPLNMQVDIIDSSFPGPLGKPATIKIPSWQTWDPTDPLAPK